MTPDMLHKVGTRSISMLSRSCLRASVALLGGNTELFREELRHAKKLASLAMWASSEYDSCPTPDNVIDLKSRRKTA